MTYAYLLRYLDSTAPTKMSMLFFCLHCTVLIIIINVITIIINITTVIIKRDNHHSTHFQ